MLRAALEEDCSKALTWDAGDAADVIAYGVERFLALPAALPMPDAVRDDLIARGAIPRAAVVVPVLRWVTSEEGRREILPERLRALRLALQCDKIGQLPYRLQLAVERFV